ncbi:MAG: AAA family ATPase [bacterium]|nr:AAA family ATPase [bacterium]
MAKIISLINQKGGVGKTTTCVNLAAYLAALGKRVLIADIDPQANATSGIGINHAELESHMYHVLLGDVHPEAAIRHTALFSCDMLPSAPDLAGAAVELVSFDSREFKLREALGQLVTPYDYVLIDSPPSLGLLTVNGLVAADEVIIPVQCEYYALEGLGQLLKTIELIREHLGRNIHVKGALLTMFDRRNRLARLIEKEVRRNFPGYVFDSIIPRNVELAEAPSFGKTILQYEPTSRGARAYRQLAEEFLQLERKEAASQTTPLIDHVTITETLGAENAPVN